MAVLTVKAARRESREEEIRLHGKPVNHHRVVTSKKVYNRKKDKADRQRGLPCFFMDTKRTEFLFIRRTHRAVPLATAGASL